MEHITNKRKLPKPVQDVHAHKNCILDAWHNKQLSLRGQWEPHWPACDTDLNSGTYLRTRAIASFASATSPRVIGVLPEWLQCRRYLWRAPAGPCDQDDRVTTHLNNKRLCPPSRAWVTAHDIVACSNMAASQHCCCPLHDYTTANSSDSCTSSKSAPL
jgi:hypothetical protein